MSNSNPIVLFFDLDGTLTESAPGIVRCFIYALGKFNLAATKEEARVVVGPPLRDSFIKFGVREEDADKAVEYFRDEYCQKGSYEASVFKGIKEALKQFSESGIPMVVVTSKPTPEAKDIVRHFGLDGYFAKVFGSSLDGHHESKDLIIGDALNMFPTDFFDPIMIGDTEFDIIGANKMGIRSIGVSWGYGNLANIKKARPESICATPKELASYILSLK